jgi:hypothetical protein
MGLGSVFRKAKTSNLMRIFSSAVTSDDDIAIWRTTADISSKIKNLTNECKQEKVDTIFAELSKKGWQLEKRDDHDAELPTYRLKLSVILDGALKRSHEINPLVEGYHSHINNLRKETIDEKSSYDFLMENLDTLKSVASDVLSQGPEQSSPKPN